ncbi:MAG TPA: tRNA epoxyqueuosine(34) reductase QueG [Casimicrobiaceae bacterium]|nr:tRNA epoxyqueuosine(34) reductase QueG [Casimicrobiaceae bacterium]
MSSASVTQPLDLDALAVNIKAWGRELGFAEIGISNTDLSEEETRLLKWLGAGRHGEMDYMARHGSRRARPAELVAGTLRVISARLDYLPPKSTDSLSVLADPDKAYISRYALGRDYHKVLRGRLKRLAQRIEKAVGSFHYRVFTDSAPVLEVALAAKSGVGWRGKHTLLLSRDAGSFFFLGEIYTDLPLPLTAAASEHCGSCHACIDACPTGAIVAAYELDARRCISYLTIELKGSIPEHLRPLIGNRVYGCDDCQLVCPWNRYACLSPLPDFAVRNGLDAADLVTLFAWTKDEFETRIRGSAIHRIGYERWLRNLAVGLGNARYSKAIVAALNARRSDPSTLVREHVEWAIASQLSRSKTVDEDHKGKAPA